MWLIETSTLKLEFFTEAVKGSYAILSHTWEENEVSFEQLSNINEAWLENAQNRKTLIKITKTCEVASQHGLSYAWVDTCCIDKSSSAELSEAINSMFRYYRDAAFCIAFISDLSGFSHVSDLDAHFERQFPYCRWLTRGWTLQELIAPSEVLFYDSAWSLRGSKNDWRPLLSKETGIDEAILGSLDGLRHVPVAQQTALVKVPAASEHLVLNLGFSFRDDWHTRTSRGWIGVYLAKTQNGFVRAKPDTLFQALNQDRLRCPLALIHVRKTVDSLESLEVDRRFERAISVEVTQFPASPQIIALEAFAPEGLWVEQRASFMHQGQGINAYIRCRVRLPDKTLRPIIVACSTMDIPVCAIWHCFDPMWDNVEQFLNNANERADFIAADYLRFHFLSQEGYGFSSSAIKHLQSQNMEKLVSVSAELEERTVERGQSRFIWRIKAWEHLEAGGMDI
ncbi:hypothetical protein GQX73_g7178 [Xylaria multiplex]|uniref:Heterokaryon incompatibility domain-containing protein n=1 Tax=Xylaria multiplex TaxID=323545 RepID=A0A7C8IL49_9PEZI|nr:hypothetical protein GQX73_g7178 [Xylaria multiplex]